MRLASVVVSSLNFTLYSHEKRKGTKQNGDKKWHQIWFSQNNEEKPYNFTKTNVQVSASPSSLHHLLYLSVSVSVCKKGKKEIRKIK